MRSAEVVLPSLVALAFVPLMVLGRPAGATERDHSSENSILFQEISDEAQVHFTVRNSAEGEKYQIETMIAGVALFDFDNDGLLDLFVANGAHIPDFKKEEPRYWNRLYRNLGGMKFEDVTERAGVRGAGYSMGVAAADYDNDGWTDLYVTGVDRNILYRNKGDGTFADVTRKTGTGAVLQGFGKVWSVGAGWVDFDSDGDLDLFVVNYCKWDPETEPACGASEPGYRTYCHPRLYDPLPNILYRNEGNGTFTDVSESTGIGRYLGKGMGVSFADFDGDGLVDIFVSNDAWPNFLFRNRDGRFEDIAMEAGVAYIDSGRPVSGMGADSGDYDGDGLPDIFMTALSNETFPLFRNLGDGLFRDERFSSGIGVLSMPYGGWSLGMVDFDNDGDLDLFTAGGHVQTNEELYSTRASKQANRLFENLSDGKFRDVSSQCGADFQQKGLHRGAAFGDLDNDGRVDAVVTRLNEGVEIFRNRTREAGQSLLVTLQGKRSNRDGLGSELVLTLNDGTTMHRYCKTAVGYGSSSDKRVHFGFKKPRSIRELDVIWPGGHRQTVKDLTPGAVLIKED